MSLWTDDVSLLWRDGRVRELFPMRGMAFPERINALVRLILLATACIYLYNRDTRHVLYGLFAVGVLTVVAKCAAPRPPAGRGRAPMDCPPCTRPTPNNPFGNVLLTEYRDNPDRPPACNVDDYKGEIEQAYAATQVRNAGQRDSSINAFYTMPDTSCWQAGREAFAQALYGTQPTCKEDQRYCGLR